MYIVYVQKCIFFVYVILKIQTKDFLKYIVFSVINPKKPECYQNTSILYYVRKLKNKIHNMNV